MQPSCSRCARLGLSCTGGGVRRFIFVDEMGGKPKPRQANRHRTVYLKGPMQAIAPNAHDSLLALLISKLSVKDLRYDIVWAYGPLMSDIPKRLGHSAALDAATTALTLTLPPSTHARRQPQAHALHSYTEALEAMRLALADPVQSNSIDTMCAAYFLLLCQVCRYLPVVPFSPFPNHVSTSDQI